MAFNVPLESVYQMMADLLWPLSGFEPPNVAGSSWNHACDTACCQRFVHAPVLVIRRPPQKMATMVYGDPAGLATGGVVSTS